MKPTKHLLSKLNTSVVAALMSGLVTFSGAAMAQSSQHKLSPDSRAVASSGTVQVIVQWNAVPATTERAKIASLGGSVLREFKFINSGSYLLPVAVLAKLESDPDVKYVSVDRQIHHKLDYSAAAVNAGAAWNAGLNGSGVGVAIIDSGINPSLNLASPVYMQDFTGATGSEAGQDEFGHGQHVAGIVASTSATTSLRLLGFNRNFIGMAPGAHVINL